MKTTILSLALAASLLFPVTTFAAPLTQPQVDAIVALLRAFNVDQATITIVETQLAPSRIVITPTQTTTPVLGTQTYQITTPSVTPTLTLVEDRPAPQPIPVVEPQPIVPPADTTAPVITLLSLHNGRMRLQVSEPVTVTVSRGQIEQTKDGTHDLYYVFDFTGVSVGAEVQYTHVTVTDAAGNATTKPVQIN